MTPEPRLIARPWSLVLPGAVAAGGTVSALDCPRLVVGAAEVVEWAAPIGQGVRASFPFVDTAGVAWQAWVLPCSNRPPEGRASFKVTWETLSHAGEIEQTDSVYRDDERNPCSAALGRLILRLVRAFGELAHAEPEALAGAEPPGATVAEYVGQGHSRRNWETARGIWMEPELGEPRMSLIVRLATDKNVVETTESIARQPRQVLARLREETRLDRVRELDAACVMAYARRPGHTAVQKAGVRQTLLAVSRVPNRDTLENRVTCWVLDALARRAREWAAEHGRALASGSRRARAVAKLARHAGGCRASEALASLVVAGLTHPVQPNYPLQSEVRYREIHRIYRLLYREKTAEDDAWSWQRVLWTDAARQLMACALLSRAPTVAGSAYYRQEQERGQWVLPGSTPAALATERGVAHWIDARDVVGESWVGASPAPWMRSVGRLGGEWLLWWPEADAALIVWPILSIRTGASAGRAWAELNAEAELALREFQKHHAPSTRLAGLVFATHDEAEVALHHAEATEATGASGPRVVTLLMPMAFDQGDERAFRRITKDLNAGLQLALGL